MRDDRDVLLLASLLSLVTTGSPAKAVMTGLVSGSRDGVVPVPLLPVAGAVALGAACGLASRRG
ncbi:hypothetical protein [Streptomyces sp. NPDC051214]|uniref:hypothetical protein n=1 Tax=Streptomyces sp. NPDC051214 TaxID=3155282 RepID=UPI0034288475